jgi:uncharacterized membrane protein
MRLIFCVAFFMAIFASCSQVNNSGEDNAGTDTSRVYDTTSVLKDSSQSLLPADSAFLGAYRGVFPCKGCAGVRQTILFNIDKTFRQEQVAMSRDAASRVSTGTWQWKAGKLELIQNNKKAVVFRNSQDTLLAISIGGASVNDPSKYSLIKKNLAGTDPAWKKQKLQGIDFAGLGNEPSWDLEIDNGKFIQFNVAGWKKPVIIKAVKPSIIKDSTVYSITHDTTSGSVTIFQQFCTDSISDYLYQYKVVINYHNTIYKGCGVLLGKKEIE